MKMKKRLCAIISIVLAIVMVIQILPMSVIAKAVNEAQSEYPTTTEEQTYEKVVMEELTEYRTENQKRFLMSDKTVKAVMYSEPVHYENDGKFYDIDTTPKYQEATDDSDVNGYISSNGDMEVKFAKKTNSGKLVTIKQGKYKLSWEYLGYSGLFSSKKIEIKEKEKRNSIIEDSVINSSRTVTYENVSKDTDLQYTLNGNGLKENIIVKDKLDEYVYSFELKANNLVLELKDNTITASDKKTNDVVFEIPAPYMYDAEGKVSYAVTYSLKQSGNKYTFTITADSEWINSEERILPVVIDPQVNTRQEKPDIFATYVSSGKPNLNHHTEEWICVGRESSGSGRLRGLIRFNLPSLHKGDMVVQAQLLAAQGHVDYYADTTPDTAVKACAISSSWNENTVTWNTMPSFNSVTLDYADLKKSEKNKSVTKNWDITEAVKAWYEGTYANNGIMLVSASENESSMVNSCIYGYYYTENGSVAGAYPVIAIAYLNNKGIEGYWSYTSASAGMAGTASVNDYSGNLVFSTTAVATTGLIMPVTIEPVYNGYMAGAVYTKIKPFVGRGWKLNIQQTVRETNIENYPYVYEDGDGTEHYFLKKKIENTNNYEYVDESGLGLKLVKSTNYTITDDKGNKMIFNSLGNLTNIQNSSSKGIEIVYDETDDSAIITHVIDGAGHIVTLACNDDEHDYLDILTDPAGRKVKYTYTSSSPTLETVRYLDVTSDADPNQYTYMYTYTYDSNNSLKTAKDQNGCGLEFTYNELSKGKRVTSVTEKNFTTNTTGQTVKFNREQYNETVITTSGKDGVINTSDDVTTVCQFDNYGRSVASYSKANGEHLNSNVYKFTAGEVNSTASNIKQLNRISTEGSFENVHLNFARNTSFEVNTDTWTYANWGSGTVTSTHERSTEASRFGNASYEFKVTETTGGAGARVYQNYSPAYLGTGSSRTYTMSAYVKTVDVQTTGTGGACIALYVDSAEGSTTVFSDYVTGTTETAINDGWQRISATVTLPASFNYLRANLSLKNATGTAYFDGIMVENTETVNAYNLLENNNFQVNASGVPNSWTAGGNNESTDSLNASSGLFGTTAFKFTGNFAKNKQIYQTVNIKGTENSTYVMSGWAKGNSVAANESNSSRRFEITAKINYSDGTHIYTDPAYFNTTISGWQYTAMPFTLSDKTSAVKTPVSITLCLRYYGQVNDAYYDGIQLTEEPSQSYTYDKDGNVISVAQDAQNKSTMEYSNSNLISTTDAKGYSYTYEYDDKHNMTLAKSQNNVKYKYEYNGSGLSNALNITNDSGSMAIRTTLDYTEADSSKNIEPDAYVKIEKDQDYNQTYYDYDLIKGTLNNVTDANGNITSYTYNANNDAVQSVTSDGKTVSYEYGTDYRLSKINHNSTQYSFVYDSMGRTVSTKVGNRTLSTNEYGNNTSQITKSTYGNGDYINYDYNVFGGVTNQKINGTNAYNWTYSTSGVNTGHTDLINGLKYSYEYDAIGRLIRQNVYNSSNSALTYSSQYGYDIKNNINRFVNSAGGATLIQRYEYGKDNLPTQYHVNGTRNHTYSYDDLNRLISTVINTTTPINIDYRYYLSDRGVKDNTTYTTTRLETEYIGNTAYKYIYDNVGNITAIQEGERSQTDKGLIVGNPVDKVTYTYDALNQLTRENNRYLNQTIVYNYDNGGNITSKVIYPYTTQADLTGVTPTQTVTYQYTDSEWKDLLTSYNGQAITYDAIGNPLTYRGYTLDWTGRKLNSLTDSTKNITYTYDAEGLRATKTVNGVKTEYQYVGNQLVYEKRGDMPIYYMYDVAGNLSGIRYILNGVQMDYYAVCNSRGDVEAFYNGAGDLKARYIYDSWGNVISIVDANGNEITDQNNVAHINPIRYRGYYYDGETNLYYLQSRYYDAEVGRFVSADAQLNTSLGVVGCNMFAYCLNNYVNKVDYNGNKPGDLFKTMDEAARDFANYINQKSIKVDREYASYIYTKEVWITRSNTPPTTVEGMFYDYHLFLRFSSDRITGEKSRIKVIRYSYVEPQKGTKHSSTIPKAQMGVKRVAIIHTHGAYSPGYCNDEFSSQDKKVATNLRIPIYVATPLGTLMKYDPLLVEDVILFYDIPYDSNHPGR